MRCKLYRREHLLPRCSSLVIKILLTVSWLPLLPACTAPGDIAPHAHLLTPEQPPLPATQTNASTLQEQWWQAFADPQLNTLMTAATAHSPTLKEAIARIRRALAAAGAVEAAGQLQTDLDVTMSGHHFPEDGHYGAGLPGQTTWDNTANLGISYHLDLFGRQHARNRQAHANIALQHASAQAARLQLQGNIVRTYIQLALQYRQREIQQAHLQQQQEIVKLTRQQLTAGLGAQYDLQQAQAQLPVTRRQINALSAAIALTRNQLVTLAGLPLRQAATLTRPKLQLTGTLALPKSLPLSLIGHRPDLVASRWQIVAQARDIDLARADFYPNINLLAAFGQQMTVGGLTNWLDSDNRSYQAGPALSLPIFDGGRRRAQLGVAAAQYDVVVEQYNATLQQALREVSDDLIRQQSITEQAALADDAVTQAERVYHTAEAAFQRGLRDYLHVLDAQTRLFAQQQSRATIHAQLLTAEANLAVALGGGIDFNELPAAEQLHPQQQTAANKTSALSAPLSQHN